MILDELRKDSMKARKERDSEKAAFLSTLISDIQMKAKNDGNREPVDTDAMAVLKKFLKSANESLEALKNGGRDTAAVEKEIEILHSYLPKQLSESELRDIITKIAEGLPEKNPKMMGKIMGELKSQYDGQYDGKLASQLAKEVLSS